MDTMINDIRMHYETRGSGPALVLIHAFPLNGSMWQAQAAALSDRYRVIMPDLRGFGGSDAPLGPYPMDQHADDLAALLDQLGIEQVILGGLSMGGYIAFAFLRHYRERVRGLILCNTRAGADNDEGRAARESNAQLAEQQGGEAIAAKMLPNLLTPQAPDSLRQELSQLIGGTSRDGIAGALRGMALRPDSSADLAQITIPTLIIVGEHDPITPPSEAEAMHAAIPHSQLVIIPAAGHLSNLEQPQAFNAALNEFVAQFA